VSQPLLQLEDVKISVEGKEIVKGVSLTVNAGEIHALMGRNGSGKSTLAYAIMGHPNYQVTGGRILFQGEEITDWKPDERAKKGIFLAFQYPVAIPGVTVTNFLRASLKAVRGEIPVKQFRDDLKANLRKLKMDDTFISRYVNDGFSGGEKKRLEILQMAMLNPVLGVLDETDSGLDIDALKIVADGVKALVRPELGVLLITHYQRILNYIKPHHVHVLMGGKLVKSGGPELALELESKGYDWLDLEPVASGRIPS